MLFYEYCGFKQALSTIRQLPQIKNMTFCILQSSKHCG